MCKGWIAKLFPKCLMHNFEDWLKLTDWSRLTPHDRYHCRSTRALQRSVALARCNATSPFKLFPRYRVIL